MESFTPRLPTNLIEPATKPPAASEAPNRLTAKTYRFLHLHPQLEHWAVLVVTPHSRLNLGPTQALKLFQEQQVVLLSMEELSQKPNLYPLLNLLTRADDLGEPQPATWW